ncbi:hypothetical protein GPJ56_004309 [Histomonas meleagridis]|uniref:uncharacterized protein n=1 Tax=Histomonas meleagridis TaxID=135588 RepID=UPI00355A9857|nr:hypothetical protein GPJ56_004309 [Histomonas meleagridis]KAH0800476.1 hypothetical protein GO595_006679 [Histomonas meleagridis]
MLSVLALFLLHAQSIERTKQNHVINLFEADNTTSESSSTQQSEAPLEPGDEIARYVSVSIAALLLVVVIVFVVIWYKQHPECMRKENSDEPISINSNEEEEAPQANESEEASQSTA